jgi:hypothetical protein
LSSLHNEILEASKGYRPDPNTKEWTVPDLVAWKLGRENIFSFKNQWVHGNRNAINAAAKRFDLPAGLVAGVAFNEVGGDPQFIDSLAYAWRGDHTRDRTSFGNVSIQVRRAAEALGYDLSNDLSPTQRRVLVDSLKDSTQNIFISAKHLADLRDRDFRGVRGTDLTKRQLEIIGARYNSGPDLPIGEILKNTSYGKNIVKRWDLLQRLIR